MSFQGTINQGIGAIGAVAGVKKVVEGQQASNELTEKTNELTEKTNELAKDQVAATEKQTEAINAQTEKLDKVSNEYNRIPTAAEELQNAQMATKALQSLLNSQYPYRNLKGWNPEKQLSGQRLNDYNTLTSALATAKENELEKGLNMPHLSKNLSKEDEE